MRALCEYIDSYVTQDRGHILRIGHRLTLSIRFPSYGKRIRDALVKASGKPLNAYVNCKSLAPKFCASSSEVLTNASSRLTDAYGDETQAELYGEPWRLERLHELKRRYDPSGRLSYYNPIKI